MDYIYYTIGICVIVFGAMWIIGYLWGYESGEKQAEKDCNEFHEKVVVKKIAGHKGALTRVKKNYQIAKKIIRKGRDERLD
jgi:hypothetical protein